jgi:hypothetical protein
MVVICIITIIFFTFVHVLLIHVAVKEGSLRKLRNLVTGQEAVALGQGEI